MSTLSVAGTVSTSTDASNYSVSVTLSSCFLETVFVAPTLADPFITVTDFLDATATFSDAGDSTGGSLCGTRTYSITDSAGSAVTWASVDTATRTVTVQPRGTGIGTQALKLVITSVEYPTYIDSKPVSFNVNVNALCDPTGFAVPSSALSDMTFTIDGSSNPQTRTIPAFEQSTCNYAETITFSPDLSGFVWISYNSATRVVTVDSTD